VEWEVKRSTVLIGIAAVSVLVLAIGGAGFIVSHDSFPGRVYDTNEFTKSGISIRVVAQNEKSYLPNFVPGAYVTLYAHPVDSTNWNNVLQMRVDDPIPVPNPPAVVLDDRHAYFFLKSNFVSTIDGARTWTTWNAGTELPSGCWGSIQKVELNVTGEGRMDLWTNPYYCKERVSKLATDNFGRTWRIIG
jgi:hypothetical protein